MKEIALEALSMEEEVRTLRRHFHRHPEESLREFETAAFVERELRRLGLAPRRLGETAVVADIVGDADGPVVALRADMDALVLQEESEKDYASCRPGLMHGCGHDAHTAMLLGAAGILARRRSFAGTVRLLFQPGEEISAGARLLIDGGALEGVEALFGLHVWIDLPSGTFSVEAGPRMASCDRLAIDIRGRGGHAGKPHQTVDAVVAASAVVMNLQTIVSRETDPLKSLVLSLGTLRCGSLWNIIAGEGRIEGTVRAFDEELQKGARARVERVAQSTASAFGAEAMVTYDELCPVTANDAELAEAAPSVVAALFGADRIVSMAPVAVSEDFAFYGGHVPAHFAFLGVGSDGAALWPHHHPRFDIDERVLPCGVAYYAASALAFLARNRG